MMATVKVAKRLYQMPAEKAEQLVQAAAEYVPVGIYAVRKGDYIELCNDPMTVTQMKKARRDYGRRGWKVYCNGL